MTARRSRWAAAVTLVEVMVTMVVLTVAILGAFSYEYFAARDAQIARAQIVATRIAQLLLEDWKSTGGSEEYDPATLGLGFSSALSIPPDFYQGSGDELGSPLDNAVHAITLDEVPMLVMCSWKNVAHDTAAGLKLRKLAVIVEFKTASGEETAYNWSEHIDPVTLVTYARVDASDG